MKSFNYSRKPDGTWEETEGVVDESDPLCHLFTKEILMRLIALSLLILAAISSVAVAKQATLKCDCLLFVYSSGDCPDDLTGRMLQAQQKAGVERAISYPSSYVPLLVPRSEIEAVRRLLGPNRVLEISPKLR